MMLLVLSKLQVSQLNFVKYCSVLIQSTSVNLNTQETKNLFEFANVQIIGQNLLGTEVRGTKKFVQIKECSNYRLFELTDVDYY